MMKNNQCLTPEEALDWLVRVATAGFRKWWLTENTELSKVPKPSSDTQRIISQPSLQKRKHKKLHLHPRLTEEFAVVSSL